MDIYRISKQNNPLYPLPAEYAELTKEGQRQARVNACRQWCIPNLTKHELGTAFVDVMVFFINWYLFPDEKSGFNPMFYLKDPLPIPQFHKDLAYQSITEWLGTATCPRGGGKSTQIEEEILPQIISLPGWDCVYCSSNQGNARYRGERVKEQILTNDRINDDWRPEYGGRMFAPRGQSSQTSSYFRLTNGAGFRAFSVGSRIRNVRPRKFYLDDPEYDETKSTDMSMARETMERLIFRIAMSTVTHMDASMTWRNTFVSQRHYAYHAMQGKIVNGQFRADDPRFDMWHRMQINACMEKDGKLVSVWPEMWPVDEEEKQRLVAIEPRYKGSKTLVQVRKAMGGAAFDAEMMGKPGAATHSYFRFSRADEKDQKFAWWFEDVDDLVDTKPYKSNTTLAWYENKGGEFILKKMPLSSFCEQSHFFITGDTSHTATASADHKAAMVQAVTPNNDILCLDLFDKICKEPVLIQRCLELADKWLVPVVCPEVYDKGRSFYEGLCAQVATRAREMTGTEHLPTIREINHGRMRKPNFISGLLPRFEHGKVKFPIWKKGDVMWATLFDQIDGFNPDMEDCGLPHDDALDVLAMSQIVLRMRLSETRIPEKDTRTIVQRMKDGELMDKATGLPMAYLLDFRNLPMNDFNEIMAVCEEKRNAGKRRDPEL